ncbi:MAG: hypothetical protein J3K34DRAFT_388468 [Monoraphidium minutum]|nr:MAG: hypothetical protein J3K34DRAFT_388468 [Monoraphidium minutum]
MACPPHPYGVKPQGQAFLEAVPDARGPGLGRLSPLSDELLLALLYQLQPADLQRLGLASKALYAFVHYDEVWKALVIEGLEGGMQSWHGSWRETYLAHTQRGYKPGSHRPLQVCGLYSDLLHQPWVCASMELMPEWLEVDNVDRVSGLSLADFITRYELPNRPVVITDVAGSWPAVKKWTRPYLMQAFAGREVIVGNAPMRLAPYLAYADANADEMPLYLFDKAFALAAPQLAGDYSVPPYFADDLFEALGEEGRPDYRWLIIGPRHSGSSFHVDPNGTSAWNAVITGAKKWILYPPGCTPPGVHISADGADIAAPVSLMEWFLNFYDAARNGGDSSGSDCEGSGDDGALGGEERGAAACGARRPRPGVVKRHASRRVRPLECIVKAGELLFVPRGWFHMVVNLEESVAVTQNFVSPRGVDSVLAFLRTGTSIPGLVSGCEHRRGPEGLHRQFLAALAEHRPEVLAEVEAREARRRERAERDGRLGRIFREAAAAAAPPPQQPSKGAGGGASGDGPCNGAAAAPAANGAQAGPTNGAGGFTFGFAL